MSPVRLVVFDLDGTLIDSSRDLASGVNAMLARLAPRHAPLPLDDVQRFIGDGARKLVERSLAAVGLQTPLEEAVPLFLAEYGQRLLQATRLYPGVLETLDRLRPRQLAVLTNKPGGFSRTILEGLGVADRFVRVYGGDDVPRKPDPAGLLRLLEETGCRADEALMVGDSANDVLTGRAAGVATVGVLGGFDPAGLDAQRPDHLLPGLASLPALLQSL